MTTKVVRKNKDSHGNLVSMVVEEDGEIQTVNGTVENILKYDTNVMEEFEPDGKIDFGDITIYDGGDNIFVLEKHDIRVNTVPSEREDVLLSLKDAIEDDKTQGLHNAWAEVYDRQVNRYALNKLIGVSVEESSVMVGDSGWRIKTDSGATLVLTWENEIYHVDQDEDKAYERSGSDVNPIEGGAEFLDLKIGGENGVPIAEKVSSEKIELSNGETLHFDEEDMEFLVKAMWLIDAEKQYDDDAFWNFIRKYEKGE